MYQAAMHSVGPWGQILLLNKTWSFALVMVPDLQIADIGQDICTFDWAVCCEEHPLKLVLKVDFVWTNLICTCKAYNYKIMQMKKDRAQGNITKML